MGWGRECERYPKRAIACKRASHGQISTRLIFEFQPLTWIKSVFKLKVNFQFVSASEILLGDWCFSHQAEIRDLRKLA